MQLTSAEELAQRIQEALNAHDLERFTSFFSNDYVGEQPAHPDRNFTGVDQVRKNWAAVFKSMPDFEAELLRSAAVKDAIWSEWRWYGTRNDGLALDSRGVIIFRVEHGQIVRGTLYMEFVQAGPGIDTFVRSVTGTQ